MGQLVFQAALGGQVNLVGPNTASTFNLNVPAASDTLVARATTDTLTNKTLTSPVISGGTIDNAVIGGTTTAAGSFTTLTTSSTTTLSGGTANGVAYLNGSKALTTGTAFVFDGTNVGIGTASPVNSGAGYIALTVNGSTQSGTNFQVGGVSTGYIYSNASDSGLGTLTATPYKFTTNGSERMRIDSSGNVGIGTTTTNGVLNISYGNISPNGSGNMTGGVIFENGFGGYSFHFGGGSTYGANWINSAYSNNSGTAAPLAFATGATERMRIDSSGNVLVGKTSSGFVLANGVELNASTSYVSTCNSTAANPSLYVANTATTGTRNFVFFYGGASQVGSITYNGSLTLYNQTSDVRLKKNIQESGSGLSKLSKISIKAFDWKDSEIHTDFGVIAQELVNVAPECVSIGDDEDVIERTWQVDTSALVPAMIKAIQEMKAIIDTQASTITQLQADVAALKGTK